MASYHSVKVDDDLAEDAAWYYPEPLPEAQKVEGHPCFYGEKVELEVDE